MKRRKRTAAGTFAGLLTAFLLFASIAVSSAFAQELTAEEKYNQLVEAGIFEGFPDGQAHLDLNMTRAQAAKIITLLLGLEEFAEAAGVYIDLEEAEWAAGFIGAATHAGILEGRGDGIFDPGSDVTIQELAKIFVLALDLEIDESATVDGADEWAASYVAAAVNAGLIPPSTDYTVPASRELLVEASYHANQQVKTETTTEAEGQPEIQSAAQTGVRLVRIELTGPVDPAETSLHIERIGEDGERSPVGIDSWQWDDGGTAATVSLTEPAEAGTYEVSMTVGQAGNLVSSSHRYTVVAETVQKIELGGEEPLPRRSDVEVPLILINQYGERMTKVPADLEIYTSGYVSFKLHPERTSLLLDLTKEHPHSILLPLTVIAGKTDPVIATRNYKIDSEPAPAEAPAPDLVVIEAAVAVDPNSLVSVVDATYLTVTSSFVTDLYYVLLDANDPEIPTAEDLLEVETRPPSGAFDYGKASTDGRLQLKVSTAIDRNYKLYLIGSNGVRTSDLLTVDIDTHMPDVFQLLSIIDLSDGMNLLFGLHHTPTDLEGTAYFLVGKQPLTGVSTPDDLVRRVLNSDGDDSGVVVKGIKVWSGSADQLYAGPNDGGLYHVYVVLEHRGVRLMTTGLLNDA